MLQSSIGSVTLTGSKTILPCPFLRSHTQQLFNLQVLLPGLEQQLPSLVQLPPPGLLSLLPSPLQQPAMLSLLRNDARLAVTLQPPMPTLRVYKQNECNCFFWELPAVLQSRNRTFQLFCFSYKHLQLTLTILSMKSSTQKVPVGVRP